MMIISASSVITAVAMIGMSIAYLALGLTG